MKIFLVVLTEVLLTLLFVFFASQNYEGTFVYTCPFDKQQYETTYVVFAAVTYLIGALSTIIIYATVNISEARTLAAYKREHEKNSVSQSEKDDIIKSLEGKVKTLETALDTVIKKDKSE